MTVANDRPVLVTVAEAMRQLGISKTKMYELINGGDIAVVRLPKRGEKAARRHVGERGPRPTLRIEQAEIDAFIARHRQAAASAS